MKYINVCFFIFLSALVVVFFGFHVVRADFRCNDTGESYPTQEICEANCTAFCDSVSTTPSGSSTDGNDKYTPGTFADGRDLNLGTTKNPVSCDTVDCVVKKVINGLQRVALIVAAIMFIVSAILFAVGLPTGDEKKITQAKQVFLYTALGYAAVLIATVVIDLVQSIIST